MGARDGGRDAAGRPPGAGVAAAGGGAGSDRVFLVSPATLSGARGRRILEGVAAAEFMDTLARGGAVPLGEVLTFISSLYYRGKRVYARRFGRRSDQGPAVWTITSDRGLVPDDAPVSLDDLRAMAAVDIDPADPAYRDPLAASARALAGALEPGARVVLLGSVASDKYVGPLLDAFGMRLRFPRDFVGRGDMSRGGLLLRAAAAERELVYVRADGAQRRGSRPGRLDPRTRVSPSRGR